MKPECAESNAKPIVSSFRISSFSDYGKTCVGVSVGETRILLTNTSSADSPVIEFTHAEWTAFLQGAKNGEFDIG